MVPVPLEPHAQIGHGGFGFVQRDDPFAEGCIIRQVQIMQACGECGARQPVGVGSIGMKGPGGVNNDFMPFQRAESALPIQMQCRAAQFVGQNLRLRQISPGDRDAVTVPTEKPRQARTKDAVAAQKQHFHRRSRRWKAGSGKAQ